jgi:hypothetical protein
MTSPKLSRRWVVSTMRFRPWVASSTWMTLGSEGGRERMVLRASTTGFPVRKTADSATPSRSRVSRFMAVAAKW